VRDELVCSQENGTVQIKGEVVYKVTDVIDVTIAEVRMETRSALRVRRLIAPCAAPSGRNRPSLFSARFPLIS
jgi:hypothetical protein